MIDKKSEYLFGVLQKQFYLLTSSDIDGSSPCLQIEFDGFQIIRC